MDKGAKFIIDNFEKVYLKTVNLPEYKKYSLKVKNLLNWIKWYRCTGDMYIHFKKFSNNKHKDSDDFSFIRTFNGCFPAEDVCKIIDLNFSDEKNHVENIDQYFQVSKKYSNDQISAIFHSGSMGGIRKSKAVKSIALFSDKNNVSGYEDDYDGDIFRYSGANFKNVGWNNPANKMLEENIHSDKYKIYLFSKYTEAGFFFEGKMKVINVDKEFKQIDDFGNEKLTWKFFLQKVDAIPFEITDKYYTEHVKNVQKKFDVLVKKCEKDNDYSLIKQRAKNISITNASKNNASSKIRVVTNSYVRNPYIEKETKRRANGKCDLCGKDAPFLIRKKEPYLECHHIKLLAENGPDSICNTVALCPNCHRKMHSLKLKTDINILTSKVKKYLQEDNDIENLQNFKMLFEE